MWPSVTGFFHSACFPGSSKLLRVLVFHSFYGWIIFHHMDMPHVVCSSVELMGVWVVSPFFDFYEYCCSEHSGTDFCMDMYFQFSVWTKGGTAGSYGNCVTFFVELPHYFPKWLQHLTIPPPEALFWCLLIETSFQMMAIHLSFKPSLVQSLRGTLIALQTWAWPEKTFYSLQCCTLNIL